MDQCMNELLPDEVIDQVAEACMNAPDMQEFFRKENPYAMEEAARRFLELHQRGKWNGDPEVLTRLQEAYLEAGRGMWNADWLPAGRYRAAAVEIQNDAHVENWRDKMREVDQVLAGMRTFRKIGDFLVYWYDKMEKRQFRQMPAPAPLHFGHILQPHA